MFPGQQPPPYQPYPPQPQPQQYSNQQPPSYQPYPPQSQPQQYPNQQPPNNGFFGSTMPPAGGMFDIFNTGVGAPSPYSTFPNAPGGVGAPPFNSDPYTRGLNQYPSPYGGPPPSTGGYNHTGPGGYGGPPPPGGYNHTGPSGYGYSYTVTETIYLKDQGVPVSNPGATHNANPYNSYDFKKAAQVDFKNMDASKASGVSFFGFVKRKLHRNYIIILDKSGSMAGSLWAQAKKGGYGGPPPPGGYNHTGACVLLAPFCCSADPDGITLFLFSSPTTSHPKYEHLRTAEEVERIFNSNSPSGTTDLAGVLNQAFNEHFRTFANSHIPSTILVITDGEPNDKEAVKRTIISATKRMNRDEELSVSFIQIGNDARAKQFLTTLDNDLHGASFDIIDQVTTNELQNSSFEEIIRKSISD
eukprot:TRINITY_DN6033_c0_g1_i6.p1 TRINITY_DN6033_c0_g1~~TRINITY_DN6033_c0_g1_i6.p1  ORF type:complete len:440 (+),score=230.08 TRINITY_DN6033_c0_g1_i6:76-1320(+)